MRDRRSGPTVQRGRRYFGKDWLKSLWNKNGNPLKQAYSNRRLPVKKRSVLSAVILHIKLIIRAYSRGDIVLLIKRYNLLERFDLSKCYDFSSERGQILIAFIFALLFIIFCFIVALGMASWRR